MVVAILSVVLSLSVAASETMTSDFPIIEESGVIEELSSFYCPSVSDNVVDAFFDG